jgi:protein-tyrosine-phosphatase/DNA-binding transcriptional ArsR family regulator
MYHLAVATVTSRRDSPTPSFLRLAGNPVRWRLLIELGRSDRRVGELCTRLELPQNLVSYHLGRLRAEHVVSRRRSSADGRDCYYLLELDRCAELLSNVGAALHPGLRLTPATPATQPRLRCARVLFICTGNSARSQIAEALAEQLGAGTVQACSAGSRPKPVHPNAIRVLRERGIDISERRSKPLTQFTSTKLDYVISLCDRVREVCPKFPGHPAVIHWSIPDPALADDSDEKSYSAFQQTTQELATRIRFLLEQIGHDPPI